MSALLGWSHRCCVVRCRIWAAEWRAARLAVNLEDLDCSFTDDSVAIVGKIYGKYDYNKELLFDCR